MSNEHNLDWVCCYKVHPDLEKGTTEDTGDFPVSKEFTLLAQRVK